MELAFDILSWGCLLIGSAFAVIGGIGIVRFPDFYTRMHSAGVTDTLGAGLIMVGLMIHAIKIGVIQLVEGNPETAPWLVTAKLVIILFFLLITTPTACYALAQAAVTHDVKPQDSDQHDRDNQ